MSGFDEVKVCVVNANRVDFDRGIDWSILSPRSSSSSSSSSLSGNVKVYHDDSGMNPSDDQIIDRCSDGIEVLVTKEITISADCIMRLPNSVKLICEAGTGYNNINLHACKERNIQVRNVPSYSEASVASLVITFLLNLSCGMKQCQAELLQDDRNRFRRGLPYDTCFEVEGKVLGIVGGRGKIGSRVATIAAAMGMKILISSRSMVPSSIDIDNTNNGNHDDNNNNNNNNIEYTTSVDYLLTHSDFVSLHCPLNMETKNLINADSLKKMKRTSYLINTARGGLVDEEALIAALENDIIAGAALDVQAIEPPSDDSPLYFMRNVILTPHIGWKRKETRQRLVQVVSDNVKNYVEGKSINVVS